MNKHQYKIRVEELEFALDNKTTEVNYHKGEFERLKKAYGMQKKQIAELRGQTLPIDSVRQQSELLIAYNEFLEQPENKVKDMEDSYYVDKFLGNL